MGAQSGAELTAGEAVGIKLDLESQIYQPEMAAGYASRSRSRSWQAGKYSINSLRPGQ